MTYSKTAWTDRAVQYPSRFTRTNDGTYDTLAPAPGTITNAGTPLTAAALNNLETQYDDAVADIEAWAKSFGLGTNSQNAPSDNLNNLTLNGWYQTTSSTTGSPDTSVTWVINHINRDSNYAVQIASRISGNDTRTRYKNNGTWSSWIPFVTATNPSWTSATLQNGWTSGAGTSYSPPQFTKTQLNMLLLDGMITAGTITDGTTLFTLPSGYTPIKDKQVIVYCGDSSTSARLVIRASGAVQIYDCTTAGTGISLTGVTIPLF